MNICERDPRRHPFVDWDNRRDGMRCGNRYDDIGRRWTRDAVPDGSAKRGARQIVSRRLAGAVGVVRTQYGEWAGRNGERRRHECRKQ